MNDATFNYFGHTFTEQEMNDMFEDICDPTDWKAKIDVRVPCEDTMLACAAIEFYTATVAHVDYNVMNDLVSIRADGYRMGPAGDH